jgi:hypothetical protein
MDNMVTFVIIFYFFAMHGVCAKRVMETLEVSDNYLDTSSV